MKLKKLFLSLVSSVCVLALIFGFSACNNDVEQDGDPTPLAAPVITISEEGVVSWDEVEHADSYEIYEDGSSIKEQAETSYTITTTVGGMHIYKVKAKSSNSAYLDSEFSNQLIYTVSVQLSTPVITSIEDCVISWQAVEHADGYEVYQDGVLIGTADTTEFFITSAPATHVYTVKATSTADQYTTSEASAPYEYSVPLGVTVGISFPSGYPAGKITVAILNGEEKVAEKEVDAVPGGYGSVSFYVPDGSYVAKVVSIENGYIASHLNVSSSVRQGVLTIIEGSEDDMFTLGENTVTISDNYGGTVRKVFRATKSGRFTIIVDESKEMTIEANGSEVLSSSEKLSGTFIAQEGDFVIISVIASGADSGEFKFTITEGIGGEKQYLTIGTGYGDRENTILYSGTYYINVSASGNYTFNFVGKQLFEAGAVITIKINGVSYTCNSENYFYDFALAAGEDIEVEINLSVETVSGFALFVYPAENAG